ncbi:MAG TPA: hypothetical protein VGS01_11440 [Candidatus Limnocylindria bacterium]|nr:hypothetical protein [Candidatus Limnocylindria bacterium]
MHASALPTIGDIGGLLAYVFGNPFLFISSTTVMTSGLLLGAALVSVLPQRTSLLRRAAPTLAIILTYFGLGSLALSTEILIRFHETIPNETEIQFVSGLGHFVEAAIGVALLSPYLRRHSRRHWLWAHTLALTYWTFQVVVLTPPWFAFQGQREAVLQVVLIMLTVAATTNVLLWRRTARQ